VVLKVQKQRGVTESVEITGKITGEQIG